MEEALLIILQLQKENEKLRKTVSQMRYHRTEAGYMKMQLNNHKRRFKRVLREIKCLNK